MLPPTPIPTPTPISIAFTRGYITGYDAAEPFCAYPNNAELQAAYEQGHKTGLENRHATAILWQEIRQERAARGAP